MIPLPAGANGLSLSYFCNHVIRPSLCIAGFDAEFLGHPHGQTRREMRKYTVRGSCFGVSGDYLPESGISELGERVGGDED